MNRDSRLASRATTIEPFRTLSLLSRAKSLIASGKDVIRLDVGEPDFGTPEPVLAAARAALSGQSGRYTESAGKPELRQAISSFYKSRYGVSIDPSRIIVTTGSSAGLWLVVAALLDQGQNMLSVSPGYPSHRVFASVANGTLVTLKSETAGDIWPSVSQCEAAWTPETRGILIASPSNPTSAVIPWERAKALMNVAASRGGSYISDELYHGPHFEEADHTALEYWDDAFVINSFSKYFSMTGWRLGWIIVPPAFVDAIDVLAQHLYLSPPEISQQAAMACFTPETLSICEARREILKERRDTLLSALLEAGFLVPHPPQGGFYVFADASRFTMDSYAFCRELLEEAHVSVPPGIDFGDFPTCLRFSFCTDAQRLEEAVRRISTYVKSDRRDGNHS
jgi:aspartate/methionine/tyrosine aminotransferase